MMRVLLIDHGANFLDFALRCKAHGHQVKWFIGPDKNNERIPVGDGMGIEKVNDWQKWMKWADIVLLSDNVKYIAALEPYRKLGYPIFGANLTAQKMELDREFGQKVMKDAGVEIMPYKTFHDYDTAIAYVEKTKKRYVSKPSGDADKQLTFCAKDAKGMIAQLQRWKRLGKLKQPFILQEFVPGIEMAVGGWFGRNGWNASINENWEHKKLMSGDLSVSTGETGCYSADTEVLTSVGWKKWPDVNSEDELATLDKDNNLFFEKPSIVVSFDFDGEMFGWETKQLDFLVTPNHNMFVQDRHAYHPFSFKQAQDCADETLKIMRVGNSWVGDKDQRNQLPAFYTGSMEAWAELLGAYIADGNIHTGNYRSIVFGNVPAHKEIEWRRIAQNAGYTAHKYGKDLYIHSVDLVKHFKLFGNSCEKFVPSYIKQSGKNVIEKFLSGYCIGDGTTRLTNLTCTTVSKRLADDVQELFHKIGFAANISIRDRRGESHMIKGYLCINKQIGYDIRVSKEKTKAKISPDSFYTIPYKGKVYCATVSSHLLLVRRNGKAAWCGNTVMRYVKKSKLADKLLFPLSDYLLSIGYTGYIDAAAIIAEDGEPKFLEHTARFGWPHSQIVTSLHVGDPVEWMVDLLHGYDSLEVTDQIATGVVLWHGDFPFNANNRDASSGFPVYYNMDNPNVHPCEMMMGTAPHDIAGKIVNAPTPVTAGTYILVASGTGPTVSSSARAAYKLLKEIETPNSPGYRNDIGERMKTELPVLQKLGYAKGMTY